MPLASLYRDSRTVYGQPPAAVYCQTVLETLQRRYGKAGLRLLERELRKRLRPVDDALDAVANDTVGRDYPAGNY